MRLIDADKLEELCDIMAEKCGGIGESIWNQFRTTVELSPTVDAIPVVRCGDCKYKDDGIDEDGIPFLKCLHGRSYGGTRINDFCSRAERKGNGR